MELFADEYEWTLLYGSSGQKDVHSRIIWSCAWSHDDKYMATCSRDKKARHFIFVFAHKL